MSDQRLRELLMRVYAPSGPPPAGPRYGAFEDQSVPRPYHGPASGPAQGPAYAAFEDQSRARPYYGAPSGGLAEYAAMRRLEMQKQGMSPKEIYLRLIAEEGLQSPEVVAGVTPNPGSRGTR